jgi:hypothetical protein
MMGDLTKNLSRHEFECECGCGFDTIDFSTVLMIQGAVDHFSSVYNAPVKVSITGPNRCKEHNEVVQKKYNPNYVPYSSKTQHLEARAADIKIFYLRGGDWVAVEPLEMYKYFDEKYPKDIGLGLYHNRVHVDSRGYTARWNKTDIKV